MSQGMWTVRSELKLETLAVSLGNELFSFPAYETEEETLGGGWVGYMWMGSVHQDNQDLNIKGLSW